MSYLYRIVFFCSCIVLLTRCTEHNYRLGAGFHAHDLIYQPKPLASRDSGVNTATYLGGVVLWGSGYADSRNGGQGGDNHQLGLLQFSRAHSWNAATLSYGTFGYLGQYTISPNSFSKYDTITVGGIRQYKQLPSAYAGSYNFYGFGFRGSAQLNAVLGRNTNWRFIGVDMVYSREYGNLTRIRQVIPQRSVANGMGGAGFKPGYDHWYIARQTGLFTIAVTTEMVFSSNQVRDRSFTLKYSLGTSSRPYANTHWFTISNFVFALQSKEHAVSATFGNLMYKPAVHLSYHYRLGYQQKKKANLH